MKKDIVLEELFSTRINHALELSLTMDENYNKVVKKEENLLNKLAKIKLSNKQRLAVDKAFSANNACSAEYGRIAYQQGFQDALKLMAELLKLM
ncbi:hypothetical protein SAMN02745136_03446 [Anaerocolumna jejuensis DSM 15929]|uniref:Uncharacterized protein n=1 Tax=Anaerocolumna jejuensis DSM 15929 TaxID=1121322 RepID=A0A1M6VPL9_9FIRM|nr:hypothetical protein [Anaerocolumna jejuensis]SHK83291.1 hypothetical protein SAMN02745136_03446 [Anaerocolumna jejuensis DSM 15929]